MSASPETYLPLDELIEMTPDLLSRVIVSPNFNVISVTSREACSEQAASGIDEVTSIVSSPSPEHSFPCRLPPEILAIIFLKYKQQYEYCTTWVPPWVNISYVCQYWRNVALNCANLWIRLFFVSSEWMDELLRRSKTAPLTIHTDFYGRESGLGQIRRSLEKALGHMERIQDLRVDCHRSTDVLDMIHARLTAAAPLLRSLHLSTYEDGDDLIICKDMLPGAGLRKLHLEVCLVDWSSPIFNSSGLVELSLSYVMNDATVECWDGLLLLLSQLPLLCQLCLDNIRSPGYITFENSFINTQNTSKVRLCQLEKLSLTDPIPWVTALLARLEFPRSTIVQVKSDCDDPEDISMFIPFMAGRFSSHLSLPQSTPSTLRSLRFHRSNLWDATWTVMWGTSNPENTNGTNHISPEEQNLDSQFLLQIVFTQMDQEVSLGGIITLFRALPLTHLNVITLHSDIEGPFDHRNPWMEVFWGAPELWIIKVGYGCANMLIYALQPRDGVIFASTLTDIRFKDIVFNRRKCRDEESHGYGTGCLRCLRNALASRAKAGIVLQRLFLDNCPGILKRDITKLSKIVGRVEWDTTEGR